MRTSCRDRRPRARARASLWVPALCALLSGCSLLANFEIHQCEQDIDCGALDGPRICVARLCVAGCASHQQCTEHELGRPHLCPERGAECVPVQTDACDVTSMELGTDPLLIGAFVSPERQLSVEWRNISLALEELNATGGIPGPDGPRRVVTVMCSRGNPEVVVEEALPHLTDTLGISAILTALDASTLRTVLARESERPPFLLSPFEADGTIEASERLFFVLGHYSDYAPAFASVLGRVEAILHQRGSEGRLASLVGQSPADRATYESALPLLEFAGTSVTELGASLFRPIEVGVTRADARQAVDQLLAFDPSVVLAFGGSDVEGVLSDHETRLQSTDAAASKGPFYILSPRNVASTTVRHLVEGIPGLARRLVGVTGYIEPDRKLKEIYQANYQSRYDAEPLGANLYDATYLLAFSLLAAGTSTTDTAISGADVTEGFRRITRAMAPTVKVGRAGLGDAFRRITRGEESLLVGVSGDMIFDPKTSARSATGSVYCLANDDGKVRYIYDSLVYSTRSEQLEPADASEPCLEGPAP